jgi:hypothetical protein
MLGKNSSKYTRVKGRVDSTYEKSAGIAFIYRMHGSSPADYHVNTRFYLTHRHSCCFILAFPNAYSSFLKLQKNAPIDSAFCKRVLVCHPID